MNVTSLNLLVISILGEEYCILPSLWRKECAQYLHAQGQVHIYLLLRLHTYDSVPGHCLLMHQLNLADMVKSVHAHAHQQKSLCLATQRYVHCASCILQVFTKLVYLLQSYMMCCKEMSSLTACQIVCLAARLFVQLVDLFQFYMMFPIDDHTGDPVSDEEVTTSHYERVQQVHTPLPTLPPSARGAADKCRLRLNYGCAYRHSSTESTWGPFSQEGGLVHIACICCVKVPTCCVVIQ